MSDHTDSPRGTLTCSASRPDAPLECHECHVICERVVSPWRCLKSRQVCIYAFEDGESTYFGCVHKVFAPELDLAAFGSTPDGGRSRHGSDPYGPVRVAREPRPQCPVSVERAYWLESTQQECVNPEFLREVFRVVARAPSEGRAHN